ncbi:MAG: 3-deoxy-manno-octulosonate cytidylyltransferase [Pseudoflavonifractor sp.]|nr:3-deoxy-manno-octulosonate cytidylyltransferase [Alloprevotella sp.]MCM1117518.1 3-deoxy-manno-octulosonate cytidylyltransferase [Pseudoflavonifractor sp.]
MHNRFIGIIPARYQSSRFPGKPLAMMEGITMIERVYRQVSKALDDVVVATDDRRILDAVERFGGKAVMTSEAHRSGTDRVAEAYGLFVKERGREATVVVNIQGDEPFIEPAQIRQLAELFDDETTEIATLVRPFDPSKGFEALFDPNLVKVVTGSDGQALYFSRSIIPYVRGKEWMEWLSSASFLTHVGMYAYRPEILARIVALPQSPLEVAESLEQLRWLQAGYKIMTAVTDYDNIGIDTPADLEAAIAKLREQ